MCARAHATLHASKYVAFHLKVADFVFELCGLICSGSGDPEQGRGEDVVPGNCRQTNDLDRDTLAGMKTRELC